MGRSFYRPRPENTVEDYQSHNSLYNRASDRYYTMLAREGRLYQRRHQVGFEGRDISIIEEQVDYVIGSGNHARSYLYRTAEGKLLELPVSWYAEKGGYWAMSPGYDRADQQDFRRPIGYDCMFCHNGYPWTGGTSASELSEPVFGDRIPEGIDCQRCHGPGQVHVEAAISGGIDRIRREIVNPARLSRDRQLEICMQCHLESTSAPLPYAIPRYDRGVFSYRPGEPLGDSFIYFDRAAVPDDRFEIAHAAYRLRISACFRASHMTCTTCHNPHRIPRGAAAVEHYVAACRSCHASAHQAAMPAGGNCIDCHMPRRRTEDAVHVVMTDHYIQRQKPKRDLTAPLAEREGTSQSAYRGPVILYYPPTLPQTAESELYLAVAQVREGVNLTAGIPRLRTAIERTPAARAEFYFELGRAYSKAGDFAEAVIWFDEALRRRAGFRVAQEQLGAALLAAGNLPRAADVLEKAVSASFPSDSALTNLGSVYLRQGRLAQARETLGKAINRNFDLADAHNLLALVFLQTGDRAAAEKSFRDAIRIQPDMAEAHHNLGSLLAGAHDYRQAAYHFEKAIASNPRYLEARHNYGLALILMGEHDKALDQFRETVRLDPNFAEAHSDLAGVLAAKGDSAGAEEHLREAIRLNPGYYEAHLALGQLLALKNALAEAREHYEKAAQSPDPAVREPALRALR